jgi:hypothetical protein
MTLNDRGAALAIALLAMVLMAALGTMLVLSTAMDVMIAAHFRTSQEAFYAADAVLQRAIDELESTADWNVVLRGAALSAFSIGASTGPQIMSDGSTIDLAKATNLLNCAHAAACTPGEMDAVTADRPWGPNNPRWTLYEHGPLSAMVPTSTINSGMYVAAWVADDTSENDNDPMTDGSDPLNPGSGVVALHAEAFGPGHTHKVLEATLGRLIVSPPSGMRIISWREIR